MKTVPLPSLRSAVRSPVEVLNSWKVPRTLPLTLVRLPQRLRNYLATESITDLGGFLSRCEGSPSSQWGSVRGLGVVCVDAVQSLLTALEQKDRTAASRWLPLAANGSGLSFAAALKPITASLRERDFIILERRLVHGWTLQASSGQYGRTREAVRQMESKLLGAVSTVLEYFDDERRVLFANDGAAASILRLLGEMDTRERDLLVSAVKEALRRDPNPPRPKTTAKKPKTL